MEKNVKVIATLLKLFEAAVAIYGFSAIMRMDLRKEEKK